MMRSKLVVAAAAALVAPSVAIAQEAVEGKGVEVSPGTVLHPNIGAEAGVINNVFYEESGSNPITSGLLRISAKFAIASAKIEPEEPIPGEEPVKEPAPQTIEFRAGLGAAYEEYLYYGNAATEAQRNFSFDGQGHLGVFPHGIWSFLVDDRIRRDTRPRNFEDSSQTDRIDNLLVLGLRYRPGGGAISVIAGYKNVLDVYEDTPVADRMNHTLSLRGEWQWRPFTKFYTELSYGFFGPLGDPGLLEKQSSNPLHAIAGIATNLTEPVTLKVQAGWGWSPYAVGPGYNGPLVNTELGYAYAPTGRVVVDAGYYFQDSTNANFFRDYKLEGRVDQQIGRILLQGSLGLFLRNYRGIPMSVGPESRDDVIVNARARAQYVIDERYYLTAEYLGAIDQTDYTSMVDGVADDPSYVRHEVMLGARAAF